ncbi:tyrosylprotein sulfotransferase isoform X2 [Wolffia australiana]
MELQKIILPLLIHLLLVCAASPVSSFHDDFSHCESVVKKWVVSSDTSYMEEGKSSLRDLLFFLHVPRTGGRTFFHCFLRKLYSADQECPRSYDKLRFDPSKSNCRLMVTHDDYSLISKLTVERTSVVTILRNPIDRVFSTYEFAAEVAARFLIHPNLTSAIQMSMRIRPKARSVSTLDIWPWKYLVPWMREDLFNRRVARRQGKLRRDDDSNPYNMADIVMPLEEFIEYPISHDIIHNGATFQIAGLTNNSWSDEAHGVRHCVKKHPELGRNVLDVAKKRLDSMLYVALTEKHKYSASMFADMIGEQILSHLEKASPRNKTETMDSLTDSYHNASHSLYRNVTDTQKGDQEEASSPSDLRFPDGNMTVGKLVQAYEECVSSLRKSQSARRALSLKKISPVNFSKEARARAPEKVLERIQVLNSLDLQLYAHAESIFLQQQKLLRRDAGLMEKKNGDFIPSGLSDNILVMGLSIMILVAASYLVVRTRRRSRKLKM